MATLEAQFELACEHFGTLVNTTSTKQQLRMYALWNQVKKGDVDTSKPPSSMNVRAHAKFMARKRCLGMPPDVAMRRYVSELRSIDPDWQLDAVDKVDSLTKPSASSAKAHSGKKAGGLFRRSSRHAANKLFGAKQPADVLDPKQTEKDFALAADYVRRSRLFQDSNAQSLLYSLFKQATVGPCTTAAPRGFSRARYARWRAWANLFDTPKHEAMARYVTYVRRFAPDFDADMRSAEEHAQLAAQAEQAALAIEDEVAEQEAAARKFDGSLGEVTPDTVRALAERAAEKGGLVYLLTGASGFIGTFLLGDLLARNPHSVALCLTRGASRGRFMAKVVRRFGESAADRVLPVDADLSAKDMGLSKAMLSMLTDKKGVPVDHFFHLAASYDMKATAEDNERANVGGTEAAVALANKLGDAFGTVFQYVSSIVVAGQHSGLFLESQLEEGQEFDNPYARTKFEAERLVRSKCRAPFKVYRPGIVVGSSETGEAEKIDGLYFYFKPLQHLRKFVPGAITLPCIEGNAQPLVPVDFVAAAMDAIAHNPDPELIGKAFHLVDPNPHTLIEVLNILARAAHTPSFSARLTTFAQALIPPRFWNTVGGLPVIARAPEFLARNVFDIPENVASYMQADTDYDDMETRAALEGTGIRCPPFERYAWKLWDYFERHMDPRLEKPAALRTAVRGKVVMVTGASDGIGKALAVRLARAGALVVLVARSQDKLDAVRMEIEAAGGRADTFAADLSQEKSTYAMVDAALKRFGAVDVLVNNAGRSIRRSAEYHTRDRFHDLTRLMELNYYGAMRVSLALLPAMRAQRSGTIVNVSTIAELTLVPRFSAYVGSKSALTNAMSCLAAEVAPDDVRVCNVYMPLVATKMVVSPGNKYDAGDLLTADQAAELIERAIVTRERRVETPLGRWVRWGHMLFPSFTSSLLTVYYKLEPEAPPKGKEVSPTAQGDKEQLRALRKLFAGAI